MFTETEFRSSIVFLECDICGALINFKSEEKHAEFHKTLLELRKMSIQTQDICKILDRLIK